VWGRRWAALVPVLAAAFYPWLMYLFCSLCGPVCWNRFLAFLLPHRIRSEVEKIVYWMPEILFAAEIAFCGLEGGMPQQKLNLLQLTALVVARLGPIGRIPDPSRSVPCVTAWACWLSAAELQQC
jgi:hypothetical protein